MKQEDKFVYYVYAYLREDGSPYYIGKGKGRRAVSGRHNVAIPKDRSRIVFCEHNLSNVGALHIERWLIRWYGRKDNGTGILRNMTDGGEGGDGFVVSEEARKKLSERNKGRPNPNKGKTFGDEFRRRVSAGRKGQPAHNKGKPSPLKGIKQPREVAERRARKQIGRHVSQITRDKISKQNKGRKHAVLLKYITNGTETKKIQKDLPIPNGWKSGRHWDTWISKHK